MNLDCVIWKREDGTPGRLLKRVAKKVDEMLWSCPFFSFPVYRRSSKVESRSFRMKISEDLPRESTHRPQVRALDFRTFAPNSLSYSFFVTPFDLKRALLAYLLKPYFYFQRGSMLPQSFREWRQGVV